MKRPPSPFVYTRPARVGESWQYVTDETGNTIHHAFVKGERVPDIEIVAFLYEGVRHGMGGYRYEIRGHWEYGRFDRSSHAVYAASALDLNVRRWLADHGEPNAWYHPTPRGYFSPARSGELVR